jgi:hypothetical protein
MTQATIAAPKAAEMPETLLTPSMRKFSKKFAKTRQNGENLRK